MPLCVRLNAPKTSPIQCKKREGGRSPQFIIKCNDAIAVQLYTTYEAAI